MGSFNNVYAHGGGDIWYKGQDAQVAGLFGPAGEIFPIIVSTTYANALINYPASTNNGRILSLSDLSGMLVRSNGIRYRPVNRISVVGSLDTTWIGSASSSEQISFSSLFPAAFNSDGDLFRVTVAAGKTNTSETFDAAFRFGTSGTVADTAIQPSFNCMISTKSIGYVQLFRRESATTIRRLGSASNLATFSGIGHALDINAAVTVANMDSNPMYLTLTSKMSVGVEIPSVYSVLVELLAAAA